ncbi:hypothetical protein PIGBHMHK_00682 [Mycoplasmopsis arginini]|nr:hypothetical protein [Mycoplasmopsis arginini]
MTILTVNVWSIIFSFYFFWKLLFIPVNSFFFIFIACIVFPFIFKSMILLTTSFLFIFDKNRVVHFFLNIIFCVFLVTQFTLIQMTIKHLRMFIKFRKRFILFTFKTNLCIHNICNFEYKDKQNHLKWK